MFFQLAKDVRDSIRLSAFESIIIITNLLQQGNVEKLVVPKLRQSVNEAAKNELTEIS